MRLTRGGMVFERGDIVLTPFPYSDLAGAKRRPVMIVSNSNLKGEDKICCLVTSNNPHDGILITKSSFSEGKLPFKSWVKPHRIFTIDKRIIIRRLAKVKDEFCEQVKDKIDYFID